MKEDTLINDFRRLLCHPTRRIMYRAMTTMAGAAAVVATALPAGAASAGSSAAPATATPTPATARHATAGHGAAGHGAPCRNGYVGLTYDDGPNPTSTTALLNALKAGHARA